MSSAGIAELVRSFVVKKVPPAKKRVFSDDLPLLSSGIIDSLGVLDLVTFLERSFNIRIADEELTPENFASINTISSFIKTKKNEVEVSTR